MNLSNEISQTFEIKNGFKIYNFNKCINALENLGKYHFGMQFKIYENDLPIIKKMLIYAIRDEASAKAMNIDIHKGIIISGPVGCGKTSLMFLLNYFFPKGQAYQMKPCRDIAFEFASKGFEALKPYTKLNGLQSRINTFCFDDLGTEKQIKHFGNECNVMAEIILSRYESFIENKTMTHVTTNLSASELEVFYGDRVRSRMRQMFNLIPFALDSEDKR
uniref:ATPase n=1 Tax=Flavobacterium sp. TaxID=239 RepID=UPI004049924B